MHDAAHEYPRKGVMQNWRRDRSYGEVKDLQTGQCYLAPISGNRGPRILGGKSLDGLVVRFRIRTQHQPVEWVEAEQELQRSVAAEFQAVAQQKAAQERAEAARLQAIADQWAARQKAQAERCKAIAEARAAKEKAEQEEFDQLVQEMSVLGFTHSRQVSAYIVRNKLGHKYKHISGMLEMEMNGNVWNFNGGFPPKIYARLCEEIGLGNQGSTAVPGKFTPYKDILGH